MQLLLFYRKKKVFKVFGALSIAAILMLNVSVVLNSNAGSVLQWDVIGKVFASGSGSGISCAGSAPSVFHTCDNGVWRLMEKSVENNCSAECPKWRCDDFCDYKKEYCQKDRAGEVGCEIVPHTGPHNHDSHRWN